MDSETENVEKKAPEYELQYREKKNPDNLNWRVWFKISDMEDMLDAAKFLQPNENDDGRIWRIVKIEVLDISTY